MNAHISKPGALFGIAFSALIAAIVYFVNPETVTSPANPLIKSDSTAVGKVERSASALKGSVPQPRVTTPSAEIANPTLHATPAVADNDTAFLEDNNQTQLSEHDLALPPPSGKNVMAQATGEFADQINPEVVVHNAATSEGEPPAEVSPDSHPPSGKNVTSQPRGEYSTEVNQHALISKAKQEGYFLPEVPADSHPPTGKNVTAEPQGENAQEITQHALVDNAKSESDPLP